MFFDIHILFDSENVPSNGEFSLALYSFFDPLIPGKHKEYRFANNLSDKSAINMEWLKKRQNPDMLSLPEWFWRVNHTVSFYKGLIDVLQKNKFSVKEIFMNLEDGGYFLSKFPDRIVSIKPLNPSKNKNSWFYYMPEEEFKSQNIFRTRLIFSYFFPDSNIENNTAVFANPDRYVISKVESGYLVEMKDTQYFKMHIGYFRYIKQKDIDSRIITEIERTGEYIVKKKDGDWWFIYKKEIDDLKT